MTSSQPAITSSPAYLQSLVYAEIPYLSSLDFHTLALYSMTSFIHEKSPDLSRLFSVFLFFKEVYQFLSIIISGIFELLYEPLIYTIYGFFEGIDIHVIFVCDSYAIL